MEETSVLQKPISGDILRTVPSCRHSPDGSVLTRAQDKLIKRLNMLKSGAFLLIVEDSPQGPTYRLVALPKVEMLG